MKTNLSRFVGFGLILVLVIASATAMVACKSSTPTATTTPTPTVTATPTPAATPTPSPSTAPAGKPSYITISSSAATIGLGKTAQFTAIGIYADGSSADITSQVKWMSSDTNVATISATGLATGVANGTTTIRASLSGVFGQDVTLVVQGG